MLLTTRQKRKRREYRLARKAAFARPEPGFSLYEGRTRGKRMKYTFSDDEGEPDSDALSVRRSTRNSGRETPAAAGPTVTASGRQVRSRATGMYGESLLSGQTTERASPATGDYVRSDVSEEPQQPARGRATRATNNAVNGWPKGRKHIETYNSVDEMDDEDDATSWDGGDEDEDEPDQMDIDDEENDSAGEASEDDQLSSLIVRLRYPKGSFNSSSSPKAKPENANKLEGAAQSDGASAPTPAPAPTISSPSAPAPEQPLKPVEAPPLSASIASGNDVLPDAPPAARSPHMLPKLDSLFRAPTPPYSAQEDSKPQPRYPAPKSNGTDPSHESRPFAPAPPLSAPTPASSWQ